MSRRLIPLAALTLLSTVPGCGERQPANYVFSGPQPPTQESVALCRSLCKKAPCEPGVMADCLSGCSLPMPMDCSYQWGVYLKCENGVSDLTCSAKGVVGTSACNEEYRAYRLCYFEAS